MVVNFRARGISQDTRKLVRTSKLNQKKLSQEYKHERWAREPERKTKNLNLIQHMIYDLLYQAWCQSWVLITNTFFLSVIK
jgi:hypothetical protein